MKSVTFRLPVFELAVVKSYNPHFFEGRSGSVRLSDGTVLPFEYDDWVELDEKVRSDRDSPYYRFNLRGGQEDTHGRFDWPIPGWGVMVHVVDGAVKFWTWPRVILEPAGPVYGDVYAVLDRSKISQLWLNQLNGGPQIEFGPGAVYFGSDPHGFISGPKAPAMYLIQKWDYDQNKVVLVK